MVYSLRQSRSITMVGPLGGLGQPVIDQATREFTRSLGISPEALDVMGHAQSFARGDVLGAIDGLLGEIDTFDNLGIDRSAVTGLIGAALTGQPGAVVGFAADALGISASDIARNMGLEGVAKGIESISGAVDGIKDTIGRELGELGENIGKGLGELGETIGEGLSDLGDAIGEGLSDIGDALGIGDDDAATDEASETAEADADASADTDAAGESEAADGEGDTGDDGGEGDD